MHKNLNRIRTDMLGQNKDPPSQPSYLSCQWSITDTLGKNYKTMKTTNQTKKMRERERKREKIG